MPLQAKPPIELQQSLGELAGRLDVAQLNWASGYLAGYAAAGLAPGPDEASPQVDAGPVLSIWYASETGNGRGVAERLAAAARERGHAVDLANLADIQPRGISKVKLLILVVSTHGEGDPPADALAFHRLILSDRAPRLEELKFSIFALGDSSYPDFCQTGRELDEALAGLGAQRVLQRVDVDVDFEDAEDVWRGEALEALKPLLESDATQPRHLQVVREPAPARHDRRNPWLAEVLEVNPLTVAPSAKQVCHVALSAENSGLVWEPGDSLGLWPRHDRRLVEDILALTGLDGSEPVERNGRVLGLGEWLESRLELTRVVRPFVSAYAELADSQELRSLLENREQFQRWAETRQVIDVLRQHPAALDAPTLVGLLRGLSPRLYSIASSPMASEDELHLTVKLEGGDADGQLRAGVASWQLTQLVKPGDRVSVYVESNPNFRLPEDPDRPIIMIGPGTGVAPFRAFLEHRQVLGHKGPNWLFFGEQHRRSDFLYQLEWQRHLKAGSLNRLSVAFSRDQADKIYVQHRLREQAGAVYDWMERGAHVYVCGNGQGMAADVHDALADLIAQQRQVEREVADEYLENLRIANRYQKDVY